MDVDFALQFSVLPLILGFEPTPHCTKIMYSNHSATTYASFYAPYYIAHVAGIITNHL